MLPGSLAIDRLCAFAAEIPDLLVDGDGRISVPGFLRWLGRIALKKSISHEQWVRSKTSEERLEQRCDEEKLRSALTGNKASLQYLLDTPKSDIQKILRNSSKRFLPQWAAESEALNNAEEWLESAEGASATQKARPPHRKGERIA